MKSLIKAGWAFLQETAFIACYGPDAKTFLQGQLTCDVETLREKEAVLGVYCTLQGRALALLTCIYWTEDYYYLRVSRSVLTAVLTQLQHYGTFSKITLHDASEDIHAMGMWGCELTIADTSSWIVTPVIGHIPRYEVYVKTQDRSACVEALTTDLPKAADVSWHCLDIQSGIARLDANTQGLFLPHRLNYHLINAISFSKGCYLGQEIIARLHYRGTLKYHLYAVAIKTRPSLRAGIDIISMDGKTVLGQLVDSCRVEDDHHVALCILRKDSVPHQTQVCIADQEIEITYLTLPYSLTE